MKSNLAWGVNLVDNFGKVRQAPRETVNFIQDDRIDLMVFNVRQ